MNRRMPYVTSIIGFLAGGIAGGIAGASAALLWGRATREPEARKMRDIADSDRPIKDPTLQKGEDLLEAAAQRVCDAAAALSRGNGRKTGGKRAKITSVKRRPGESRDRSPFSA